MDEHLLEVYLINTARHTEETPVAEWVSLPTDAETMKAVFERLGVDGSDTEQYQVSAYQSSLDGWSEALQPGESLDDLNYLAVLLTQRSDEERDKFAAAVLCGDHAASAADLINLTHNLDCYWLYPTVHNSDDYGHYLIDDLDELELPDAAKRFFDYKSYGREAVKEDRGIFTDYGYVYNNGNDYAEWYKANQVPQEYRLTAQPSPQRDMDELPQGAALPVEPIPVRPLVLNATDTQGRIKEITEHLEQGVQEVFESERYRDYLKAMSRFHNYSLNNTLLIVMQKPDASLIAGYGKWRDEFERHVKSGEKGIKILAPAPYKIKKDVAKTDPDTGQPVIGADGKPVTEQQEVTIPAFKVVSVFDVSQTEGEPLPTIAVNELSGSVQDYQDFFKALEQASPVPIGFEDIEGEAHGYFHLLDNRIAIQEGMSQLQTIKTAIHEIAHAKLHAIDPTDPEQTNRPDSRTREVQAESVAYAVCQHYGLDTSEYSFGYVAGWSSGRELAELKASLEVIRSTAHELISALDEHLAELRQQREADLSAAQETAFVLDSGNTLFIQTCDSGYDYTLYGPDKKALDGGQLDAPGLTLPDAGQEALNLLGQTAAVSEVLLGDKLAAFQDAAEKANELPAPVKIPDPAAEPTVTILWSESDKLQDGEIMPLSVANRVFEELDTAQHTDREKDGYTGGWYDKTAFRIDFTMNGQPDNYEGRQDFGDGEGSLVQHIQNYHEYYTKDENWKNFVLHNKGPEAWEQDKAEREMVLTEFIPYLKQHCNLSAMEQTATAALREGQNISPEQAAYYNAVVAYVQDCRPLLNQGQYDLPEPPKLADFDQTLQDYKAQVQAEIAQEAADAGMTVEEYAAAGFEAPQQDSFSIYQLRNEDSTRDYRFEPYDRLQAADLTVDKANYTEVYAAPLAAGTTLEDLYRTFNVDHPADFKGHSLSVSDVVVLHQNGQDTAHYCDSVGFQQVPEFLRENPLRTAELSTEQNENMIDGVLNNAPSLGELEAKAKAGEQISLTDLAAAVKAEEKAPKAKKSRAAKPKKPSIRAQLDAAKKEQSKQTPPREKTKELEV